MKKCVSTGGGKGRVGSRRPVVAFSAESSRSKHADLGSFRGEPAWTHSVQDIHFQRAPPFPASSPNDASTSDTDVPDFKINLNIKVP